MTAAPREATAHIGLLFRGDRTDEAMSPKAATIFGPLVDAFADLNVVAEPVAYADDAVDEIRDQLLELDGANPMAHNEKPRTPTTSPLTTTRDTSRPAVVVL